MRTRPTLRRTILFLALAVVTPGVLAGEVDSLTISKDFLSLPRERVVVVEVPQPASPGGKLQLAPTMGAVMTQTLVSALQARLPNARVNASKDATAEPPGLLVEAHFSEIVPGSRAKRFWVGFGAGKSSVELAGTVKDLTSGRVVARFSHRRMSFCCGFGDNDKEIRDNLNLIAEDVVPVLAGSLAPSQGYEWLAETSADNPGPKAAASTVVLKVESTVADADVEIDGKYVGSTPLEIPLPAGPHVVVVRKKGFHVWERSVTLVEGATQRVSVELIRSE